MSFQLEREHSENKRAVDFKFKEVEKQNEDLRVEKSLMIVEQLKLETKISTFRSKLAFLKSSSNRECLKCDSLDDLKLEISILNQTNKQLIDTNDVLLQKTKLNLRNNVDGIRTPSTNSKLPSNFFPNNPNNMSTERSLYEGLIISDEETGK